MDLSFIIVKKLEKVFGIHSIVICHKVNTNTDEIETNALQIAKSTSFKTFKVETSRADKKFPISSMEFSKRIGSLLLKNIKDISLTTDLIVGFPGEGEEEFQETLDTLKEIEFTKIHTFPYSKREGTPASVMENQVDGVVKKRRVKEVLKLSSCLEHQFYLKYLNQTLTK